jgi:endonuclease YncB( thermonuclease family)
VSARALRILVAASLAALVGSAACAGTGDSAVARTAFVARIVDGDTLIIRGGKSVRLVQIDAPEAGGECYSAASTRELTRLAPPGSRLTLGTDPRLDRVDVYGRLLRYVEAAGRNVNVELVRRGAATPYFFDGDRGRHAAALLAAVSSARTERRGMWRYCRVFWRPEAPIETRER